MGARNPPGNYLQSAHPHPARSCSPPSPAKRARGCRRRRRSTCSTSGPKSQSRPPSGRSHNHPIVRSFATEARLTGTSSPLVSRRECLRPSTIAAVAALLPTHQVRHGCLEPLSRRRRRSRTLGLVHGDLPDRLEAHPRHNSVRDDARDHDRPSARRGVVPTSTGGGRSGGGLPMTEGACLASGAPSALGPFGTRVTRTARICRRGERRCYGGPVPATERPLASSATADVEDRPSGTAPKRGGVPWRR